MLGERIISNLTRFVVIVWMFVVLVLGSSYTASLTSMLTVQQLQPTITDVRDLIEGGEYVGYQYGSFVTGLLRNMNFDTSKLRGYRTLAEYDDALSKGSRNGGVAAIVDELPYIRLLLSKYCGKYTMIGPIYQTSGFGFVSCLSWYSMRCRLESKVKKKETHIPLCQPFQKGSPLVADVSRAILRLKEDEEMERISRKWFREGGCDGAAATVNSKRLSADSFKGLFLVAGLSSSLALAVFVTGFVYENRAILSSTGSTKHKIHELARAFYQRKEGLARGRVSAASQEEPFSQDEGPTPIHHETQG